MNFLEGFYNLFFHPLFLLKQDRKPFTLSLFISLLSAFSLSFSLSYLSPILYILFSILLFLYLLLILVFSASFYHFLSEIFKGKGRPGNLLNSFLLSLFPLCLLPSFNILSRSFRFIELQSIISPLIFFWVVFLQIYIIKNNYGLEGGTAVFVYFIPFLALMAIGILFFLFSLSVFTLFIGKNIPLFLNLVQ
ncbi:MAG: hypothetical protein GXO71_07340 [Caldiserica bacterium]|nr:hypothetical protein [Caldisericota bacterium]